MEVTESKKSQCTSRRSTIGRQPEGIKRFTRCTYMTPMIIFWLSLILVYNDEPPSNYTCTRTLLKPPQKMAPLKYSKSRVLYYANSPATHSIILDGDIESNPGPALRNNKPKCSICLTTVGTNRKRSQCEKCFTMTHITCLKLSKTQQNHYTSAQPYNWLCSNCSLSELPFFKNREIVEDTRQQTDNVDTDYIEDIHINILQQHQNRISIGHLNTQSLLPSMVEFTTMGLRYNLDIYTISETWMQDNPQQKSVAEVEGYKLFTNNRTWKRGGGVAIYVKDHIVCKQRDDLSRNHEAIEVLIVEAKGRNKNTPYLIVTLYQPDSKETEKLPWLEKFDSLISDLNVKWSGPLFVVGDINIDLIGEVKESTRRYKNTQ